MYLWLRCGLTQAHTSLSKRLPNVQCEPSFGQLYRWRGPCSVVGIATGYGLDGPEIESRWWRDFPHLSRPALGPTQPPVQWAPGLSRGEWPGRDADPSPASNAVVMKG
jgi:hypothetical protein